MPPPTSTGGWGFWIGFGHVIIGPKSTNLPWYSGLERVQMARMASMRSRMTVLRCLKSVP